MKCWHDQLNWTPLWKELWPWYYIALQNRNHEMLASSTEMNTIMKGTLIMILDYFVKKNLWNAAIINWNEQHYERNFNYDIKLPYKKELMNCWHDQLKWTLLWKELWLWYYVTWDKRLTSQKEKTIGFLGSCIYHFY